MTPTPKRTITRQANILGDILCDRFANELIKCPSCPGCRLLRLTDKHNYRAMQKVIKRYRRFLDGRS